MYSNGKKIKQSVPYDQNKTLMLEWKTLKLILKLVLQCIITVSNSTVEDIKQLFQYELRAGSSVFIWLFWIYERDRHTLHFWNMCECGVSDIPKECTFVLDGGLLLQWVQGSSFGTLRERYYTFVWPNYLKPHIMFMDTT